MQFFIPIIVLLQSQCWGGATSGCWPVEIHTKSSNTSPYFATSCLAVLGSQFRITAHFIAFWNFSSTISTNSIHPPTGVVGHVGCTWCLSNHIFKLMMTNNEPLVTCYLQRQLQLKHLLYNSVQCVYNLIIVLSWCSTGYHRNKAKIFIFSACMKLLKASWVNFLVIFSF